MSTYYPSGSVNVHNRAIQLIKGGNINLLDLQWRKMYSHVTQSTVYTFRCDVVPSLKSKTKSANEMNSSESVGYAVYLCFGNNNDSVPELLEYPSSCCGCADGRKWCSHLQAVIGLFHIIQRSIKDKKWTREEFESRIPCDTPLLAQNIPIPFECFAVNSTR